MKYIRKGKEPDSLTQHRAKGNLSYDDYREKDELRECLVKEQGYICCYCMQRIKPHREKMRIEHWHPQSKPPDKQLDYRNMLGACTGNEGKPKVLHHCDKSRGEKTLTINPTNESCETLIKFSVSGKISSDNEQVNKDLNETLNLNMESLIKIRKLVLDEAIKNFQKKHPVSQWTKEILEREISRWSSSSHGAYKPYCQIVIYYFQKKLSRR